MKKTFIIILTILLIILVICCYYVYNVRKLANLTQNHNKPYEDYYQQQVLGNSLISIINKAINYNEQNDIQKIQNTIYYENNNSNSIHITVKFSEREDSIKMEEIAEQGTESFMQYFATSTFKCTSIQYHKKTNNIKSLHFEQIN